MNKIKHVIGVISLASIPFSSFATPVSVDDFIAVIESRNRAKAGTSVKAKGLFLSKVDYPEEIFKV